MFVPFQTKIANKRINCMWSSNCIPCFKL